MAALRDVAARAGVSIKTVSNVIHGRTNKASAQTRERVLQAIAELEYSPNLSARALRAGRSGQIGLVVPELDHPYFAELTRCVVEEARERGWVVLIEQTDRQRRLELDVLSGREPRLVDGLVFSPYRITAADLSRHHRRVPMVLVGAHNHAVPADQVAIDNVAAARDATRHLLGSGSRRIGVVGVLRSRSGGPARLRLAGHTEALREAGHQLDERLVCDVGGWKRADGALGARRLLQLADPPDALFCLNDVLALGALHELRRLGRRVPEDVAVMGFDDIEESRFSNPSLSTLASDRRETARVAVQLLADRIEGRGPLAPRRVVAGHRVVARESTARARRRRAGGRKDAAVLAS